VAYTTTDLLAAIKRRAQLPAANGALSDADLLDLATLAMRTQVQPLLRSLREDYSVVVQRQAIVADRRTYPIPSRAEGGAVRDLWMVRIAEPQTEVRVPYIPPEDRPMYQSVRSQWWDGIGAYTVEGNDIWLSPIPSGVEAQYTLSIRYYLRPGRFVPTSDCMEVISWSAGPTTVVTVDTVGSYTTSSRVDIIGGAPPFRPRAIDIGLDGVSTGPDQLTIIPADYEGFIEDGTTGDYVCETDTTCVVTCPVEAQEALIAATVASVYEVLGYERELSVAVAMRDTAMQAVRVLMEPRTEGASRVLLDPRSPLRRGRRSSW